MAQRNATTTTQADPYTVQNGSNPCLPPRLASGPARIRLHHVVGPTCWWSWGYEAVIHRVRLVYGDQVEIVSPVVPVWQDLEDWLGHNGLDHDGWEAWAKEAAQAMGVPIFTAYGTSVQPRDSTPAAFAVLAARRQGIPQGERMARALLRRSTVEGRNVAVEGEILEAARESRLDVARFERDLRDRDGLARDLEEQSAGGPPVHLGFYNLCVESDDGRRVVLDNAFDPAAVEEAIDFLGRGKLRKNRPSDPVEYLRATGPAPAAELARVFAWRPEEAKASLDGLVRAGRLRTVTLAGAPHYEAAA